LEEKRIRQKRWTYGPAGGEKKRNVPAEKIDKANIVRASKIQAVGEDYSIKGGGGKKGRSLDGERAPEDARGRTEKKKCSCEKK